MSPSEISHDHPSACPTTEVLGGAKIDPALLDACIHCGLCLPACPTYLATGRETESPRGRIYLLNLWQRGEQELQGRMMEHIESCLGCLGCQTACPSGVQYGKILTQARPAIAALRPKRVRRIMRFVFAKILPDYGKLQMLGKMLRLWQSAGGRKILPLIPGFKKMLGRLDTWQSFLPTVPEFKAVPKQAWVSGEKKGTVSLFTGCVMDIFYNHVNHACQRLLLTQRRIVRVPEQTCCGALAAHAGEVDIAKDLARRNIEYFENTEGDIVVTAAGCGAMLKEYGELLADDQDYACRAEMFSKRVRDITEALAAGEFSVQPRSITRKVAYHAACHLYHAQKISSIPEKLISQIDGIDRIELAEAEHCCGSAGIFNLTHEDLSLQILRRKIEAIRDTGAQELVTTNPGCMLQIEAGLRDAGVQIKVRHLSELLDEAYCQQ